MSFLTTRGAGAGVPQNPAAVETRLSFIRLAALALDYLVLQLDKV